MKIKKVLMGVALAAMCLMSAQAQRRNEIQVPNLNGYTTLKCDFHMHSVFSDGLVWPTVRVDEAYREGRHFSDRTYRVPPAQKRHYSRS